MPSKGKRIAARQNSLSRRRGGASRTAAPSGEAVAVPAGASTDASGALATATAPSNGATAAAQAAPAGTSTRAAPQPRGRRFDRPAAYNHVGSELIRIGIYSGVLVVALVAVSFVM
jgi:hypothetical protein